MAGWELFTHHAMAPPIKGQCNARTITTINTTTTIFKTQTVKNNKTTTAYAICKFIHMHMLLPVIQRLLSQNFWITVFALAYRQW